MRSAALIFLTLGWGGLSFADDALPKAPPASRYDKLAQHSPFSPPTAAAPVATPPPAAKAPGWADSLAIAAVMQEGSNYLLTIVDRSSNERFVVSSDSAMPNSHDVALTGVQWSDIPNQTQATLRKGTEFAMVKFDADVTKATPQTAQPALPGAQTIHGITNPAPPRPPFNPPPPTTPAAGVANGVRRNQIIRATPAPPSSRVNGPPLPGGLPKLPGKAANDDDDDDDN